MDGLACTLLWPGAHHRSDEGTGFPTELHLVPSSRSGRWCFVGGYVAPSLGCLWNVDCLGTYITGFYIECIAFYYGILTLWWKGYGEYV
jgi:hypothetical protein